MYYLKITLFLLGNRRLLESAESLLNDVQEELKRTQADEDQVAFPGGMGLPSLENESMEIEREEVPTLAIGM